MAAREPPVAAVVVAETISLYELALVLLAVLAVAEAVAVDAFRWKRLRDSA